MTIVRHDGTRWSNAAEDRIEVVPYDPAWPERFAAEAAAIRRAVGTDLDCAIEHIGSTAVPGLAAKPIIDIALAVADRSRWPDLIVRLAVLEYVHWDGNPDPTRMFFVKGMPPFGTGRTHHVHVHTPDVVATLVRFRDVLRADPSEVDRYADLKRRLALEHPTEREAYTNGKAAFVAAALRKAANA